MKMKKINGMIKAVRHRSGKLLAALGCMLTAVLLTAGAVLADPAGPITVGVEVKDGWRITYTDGHSSGSNGIIYDENTGEWLYCVEPHENWVRGERSRSVSLASYFGGDKAFANRLTLIAYFASHNGWGENGWAVAQNMIWAAVMQRNGESGTQYFTTAALKDASAFSPYYAQVEAQIRAYQSMPSFHQKTVSVTAGTTLKLEDSNQVLSGMTVGSVNGPLKASIDGNTLVIRTEGSAAAKGVIALRKPLPQMAEGSSFVFQENNWQSVYKLTAADPAVSSLTIEITEAPADYTVLKTDGTDPLSGAQLVLKDKNGTVLDSWTSERQGHSLKGLKNGAEYILQEVKAPDGYATAQEIAFAAEPGAHTITMKDEQTRLAVSKTDITGEKELPGAAMQLSDENGTLIEEWTSTEEPHLICGLTAGRTYILTERRPPDGFATAEEIRFTVEDTGRLQTVRMEDEETKTIFSKQSVTGTKELPGALLQLLDEEGTVLEEWTGTEEPHLICGLTVGKTYRLKEIAAPEHYLKQEEEVTFLVEDTGEIQTVIMKDEPIHTEVKVKKEAPKEAEKDTLISYKISCIQNASNVELEDFTLTDELPEQFLLTHLETGSFSEALTYRISFRCGTSPEWICWKEELSGGEVYSLPVPEAYLRGNRKITAIRYEFGTVPVGFQSVKAPVYEGRVCAEGTGDERLVNRIKLRGIGDGEPVNDEDKTITEVPPEPEPEEPEPEVPKPKEPEAPKPEAPEEAKPEVPKPQESRIVTGENGTLIWLLAGFLAAGTVVFLKLRKKYYGM